VYGGNDSGLACGKWQFGRYKYAMQLCMLVIASAAKQSMAKPNDSGLLRFARNDGL
jgi:hypothetical protein